MTTAETLRTEIHDLEPLILACREAAKRSDMEAQKRAGGLLSRALDHHLGTEAELLRALDDTFAVHQGSRQVLAIERDAVAEALSRLQMTRDPAAARSWLGYAADVAQQICDDEERRLLPIAEGRSNEPVRIVDCFEEVAYVELT